MKARNLKIIKCSKIKDNSMNKSVELNKKNNKTKILYRSLSPKNKFKRNPLIKRLINDINSMEKQIQLENKKLLWNKFIKSKSSTNRIKYLNNNTKNLKLKTTKYSNKNIFNSKSNPNKIIKSKKVRNSTSQNSTCASKDIKKQLNYNKISLNNKKSNIIRLPFKLSMNKKSNNKNDTVKENSKEIIKYINAFYKDNKQISIKSIDIPTNTNSDISSMNSSFFINYHLGNETIDEMENISINEYIKNFKLNKYNIITDKTNINNEIEFVNLVNNKHFLSRKEKGIKYNNNNINNNNKSIVYDNYIKKKNNPVLKTNIIYFNKSMKLKNNINKIKG